MKLLLATDGRTELVPSFLLVSELAFAWLTFPAIGQTSGCFVETATNGDHVKVRGEVYPTGHDTFFRPKGCPDKRVILTDGDDRSPGKTMLSVRRDEAYRRFEELLGAHWPLKVNEVGTPPSRYRVSAALEGRLDVAPSAGLKKDPKTGKVTGIEGFGHPLPFTRYRLVVTGVSNVEAIELPEMPTIEKQ